MTTASISSNNKASIFRSIAHARRSANRFQTGRRIPNEILKDVLTSTLRAPSSFNLQPTQIILIQDDDMKQKLAQHVMLGKGNQYRVQDCSVVAVFLADLEAGKRIQRIYDLEKEAGSRHPNYMAMMPLSTSFLLGEGHLATWIKNMATDILSISGRSGSSITTTTSSNNNNNDNNVGTNKPLPRIESIKEWSYKNTSLMVQSYLLAATSYNLATTPMEGFDPRRAMEVLRIPDRYAIPMMVATGYDYDEQMNNNNDNNNNPTPRLALNEIVFQETFGEPWSFPHESEEHPYMGKEQAQTNQ